MGLYSSMLWGIRSANAVAVRHTTAVRYVVT